MKRVNDVYRIVAGAIGICLWPMLLPEVGSGQDQLEGEPSREALEACSIFDVSLGNVESWERGDVLVRVRTSLDNVVMVGQQPGSDKEPSGLLLNDEKFLRISFDFPNDQFCWRTVTRSKLLFLDSDSAGPPFQRYGLRIGAKLIPANREDVVFFDDLQNSVSMPRSRFPQDQSELLTELRYPDVRGMWMSPMALEVPDSWIRGRREFQGWKSARNFKKTRVNPDGSTELFFELSMHGRPNMPAEIRWNFEFDSASMMLNAFREFHVAPGGMEIAAGTEVEGPSSTIKWKDRDGIFVPSSIKIQKVGRVAVGSSVQGGVEYTDIDFHWFSINQELDPELFEPKSVKSRESVVRMSDPVQSGAEGLIEKKRHGKIKISDK